jgi:Zn-dependent protease/predicted transcriptional regulator
MNETIRLGHIAGVRIGVNWTVLVIFSLILIGLATVQFPLIDEDLPVIASWAAGLIGALAFFASLLAHELAHALVARRHGIEVEGIVLWLFGGVAKLKGEAPNPEADLRIAGVGPLVSIVLGLAFTAVAIVLAWFGASLLVVAVFGWLGLINIVLALFNLVPASPLDGGRILRAILWKRRGDRTTAAITAARAGRVFGFVLIALGLLQAIFIPGLGGLWMVLIGWFLTAAAAAEEQQARVHSSLGGLRVADLMTRDPVTVRADITVASLLDDYVLQNRFSAFPVVDENHRPVGLVTLNRIKSLDAEQRRATYVGDIACAPDEIAIAGPEEAITAVLPRLGTCADGRAIVALDGRVVGILSPTDIARMIEIAEVWQGGTGGSGVGGIHDIRP